MSDTPTRTLYLIRHGETAWNRDRIFRGRADVELSERGVVQASTASQVRGETAM